MCGMMGWVRLTVMWRTNEKPFSTSHWHCWWLVWHYSPLWSRLPALSSHVILNGGLYLLFIIHSMFLMRLWICHWSGVLTVLFGCYMAGATWSCCHLGTHSVYTIQPCTSLQCHFMQSHKCRTRAFSCNPPPALGRMAGIFYALLQ